MHLLSAVFIDGARMLSRGSIVDALQGIPALIKERMKLNPHTMERFRSKTHHFAYRLHSNVQKQIFRKKFQKGRKMVPFLAWKSRKTEGLVSQNVSLYICYINYSEKRVKGLKG